MPSWVPILSETFRRCVVKKHNPLLPEPCFNDSGLGAFSLNMSLFLFFLFRKPSDWDEREKIPDPEAVKPDEWDEDAPRMILDESAVKPEGWLDDEPDMIPDPEV